MLLDHWNYANHFVTWWLKGHTHQQYSNRVLLVYQVVEFSSIVHLVLPTVHSLENRWKHAKIKILKQTNINTQPNNQPPNTRVCVIDVPETLCLNLLTNAALYLDSSNLFVPFWKMSSSCWHANISSVSVLEPKYWINKIVNWWYDMKSSSWDRPSALRWVHVQRKKRQMFTRFGCFSSLSFGDRSSSCTLWKSEGQTDRLRLCW